jgi:hypothetical protein
MFWFRRKRLADPKIRLVTPARSDDATYPTRDIFEKMLKKLLTSMDYDVCYGEYDIQKLIDAATKAVNTDKADVIVTAGVMATKL